jgi:ATP-binding cassette subfamily F protein uup
MNILSAQSLEKSFGVKHLFDHVTLGLEDRDRLGLIGLNGSGKSTLLKILAGAETPDAGTIAYRQGLRIEYLPQNPAFNDNHTVLEHILSSDTERAVLVRRYEATCRALATRPADAPDPAESERLLRDLDQLTHRMDSIGAWEFEARVKIVLGKLSVFDLEKPVGQLSGGYRKRIALAHALLAEADLLLLDEPTNHLDADAIDWLETYLQGFAGAVVLVTHDRYFLDRVTRRILEIDRRFVRLFDGNFTYYLEKKAEVEAGLAKQEERRTNVLRREMQWLLRGARARATKEKAHIRRIETMREAADAQAAQAPRQAVLFSVMTRRLGGLVVEIDRLSKSFGDRQIIRNYTHVFQKGERLGVLGPNGCGKSTLVNMIVGRLAPDSGTIKVGETVFFGYYDQESAELDLDERVIDYAKREGGEYLRGRDGTPQAAEVVLEQFHFTPQNLYTPIGKLSGGERRRLYLVRTLLQDPNFLILDEPTNDLDIQTLQSLEDFLDGFDGVLLVISHDRYFLDRTVDHVLVFGGDGSLRSFPGAYSTYARMRDEERAAQEQAEKKDREAERSGRDAARGGGVASRAGTTAAASAGGAASEASAGEAAKPARARKLTFNEVRELAALEKDIPVMEARQTELEQAMLAASSDYVSLHSLSEEQHALEAQLDAALHRWEELASLAQQ